VGALMLKMIAGIFIFFSIFFSMFFGIVYRISGFSLVKELAIGIGCVILIIAVSVVAAALISSGFKEFFN
jgi:hypothetical protein